MGMHPQLVEVQPVGFDPAAAAPGDLEAQALQLLVEVLLPVEAQLEGVVFRGIRGGVVRCFGHLQDEVACGSEHTVGVAKIRACDVARRVLEHDVGEDQVHRSVGDGFQGPAVALQELHV